MIRNGFLVIFPFLIFEYVLTQDLCPKFHFHGVTITLLVTKIGLIFWVCSYEVMTYVLNFESRGRDTDEFQHAHPGKVNVDVHTFLPVMTGFQGPGFEGLGLKVLGLGSRLCTRSVIVQVGWRKVELRSRVQVLPCHE